MKAKYFKIQELVDRRTYSRRKEKAWELIDSRLIETLDELRELFGVPITVNNWLWDGPCQWRGLRTPDSMFYKKYSQHSSGRAVDFDVKNHKAEHARKKITEWKKQGKLQHLTGLETNVSWVHIDVRNSDRLESKGLFKFDPVKNN